MNHPPQNHQHPIMSTPYPIFHMNNNNNNGPTGLRQNNHIIVDHNNIDNKFDMFAPSLVPSIPDPRAPTPVPQHMQHVQVGIFD